MLMMWSLRDYLRGINMQMMAVWYVYIMPAVNIIYKNLRTVKTRILHKVYDGKHCR